MISIGEMERGVLNMKNGFNDSTIPWVQPDMKGFDFRTAPEYIASQTDVEAYQRDGVVVIRGAFEDWVPELSNGLARNIDNPQAYRFPCESNPTGAPGRFFDSYCNWDLIPEYRNFITCSSVGSMAGQFADSQKIQLFHEHAFVKEPGTQQATPWHQDMPYYCIQGVQTVSVYISLDYADSDVAVRFVKGSHKWGRQFFPRVFLDGEDFNTNNTSLESVPDINTTDFDIFESALAPGDAVLFHFCTLHGTTDARLKNRRRAMATRWMGDDVRYEFKAGETSPPLPKNLQIKTGDTMPEDWFPLIWRNDAGV